MATVSVILPAAGSGTRFGGKQNKIFQRIKGQPLFIRTLELFTGRKDVCQALLVVSPAEMEEIKERFGPHLSLMGATIVAGGASRPESVRNALSAVAPQADLVCVHDAVRPCVSPLWVDAVFAAAEKTGAAILAYPVHGTLKKVSPDKVIQATVPRAELWEAQTPQVFRKELLVKAYAGDLSGVTDDAQLVEAMGHPVSVVPGDPRNVKVTTPSDLALAAAVIDSLPKPKVRPRGPFDDGQW